MDSNLRDKIIIFNLVLNIILLSFIFLGGILWADSNGLWERAEDILPGVFGGDEAQPGDIFTFNNSVYFNKNLVLKGDGYLNLLDCGKIYTDFSGKLMCGVDNVNDADSVVGNEYPLSGYGTYITNNREVNVNTSVIQKRVYSSCPTGYSIRQINEDGTVVCEYDDTGSISTSYNVYKVTNRYCVNYDTLTTSSTCKTRDCSAPEYTGTYSCTGTCEDDINTCPNTYVGKLVS